MRFTIAKLNISSHHFLRTCGYIYIQNPHKSNETSYVRGIEPSRFYPRFHIYINETNKNIEINLHLDMKKPIYKGVSAHSGEYQGELVLNEMQRIIENSKKFILQQNHQPLGFQPQKSWWRKIIDLFK